LWEKKDKQCDPDDPADAEQGSYWDHILIDPDTKLVVTLVVGRRNGDTVVQAFTDFCDRTGCEWPELITTDGYAVYETVILDTYGVWLDELDLSPEERARFESLGVPEYCFPDDIAYARVVKEREGGRVVAVNSEIVFGTEEQVEETLATSETSKTLNTSFAERWFGTQRQFNARKKRKAYTFSKDLSFHVDCTWLVLVCYNFCWCVRTLRQQVQEQPPRYQQRTPAMAAGLADHPWSMHEFLSYPLYPKDPPEDRQPRSYKDVLDRIGSLYEEKASP
jgi:hypothetical protein